MAKYRDTMQRTRRQAVHTHVDVICPPGERIRRRKCHSFSTNIGHLRRFWHLILYLNILEKRLNIQYSNTIFLKIDKVFLLTD